MMCETPYADLDVELSVSKLCPMPFQYAPHEIEQAILRLEGELSFYDLFSPLEFDCTARVFYPASNNPLRPIWVHTNHLIPLTFSGRWAYELTLREYHRMWQ